MVPVLMNSIAICRLCSGATPAGARVLGGMSISLTIGPIGRGLPDPDDCNLTVKWDKHRPIFALLEQYVEEKCVGGALFAWDPNAGRQQCPPPDVRVLRMLYDGDRIDSSKPHFDRTPAQLDMEDGDYIDVMIGQGGGPGCYPRHAEVFNTREGALKYYQQESRRAAKRLWDAEARIYDLEQELRELRKTAPPASSDGPDGPSRAPSRKSSRRAK